VKVGVFLKDKLKNALILFTTFFKIGAFTFGGGYAMIPIIEKEMCEKHKWLKGEEILDIFAISESTPGPIAINSATFVGYRVAGTIGSFFATLGVLLPSFVIILIVARIYKKFQESNVVKGCMTGLRPTVIGLIAAAVLNIGTTVFFPDGISLAALNPYNIIVSLIIAIIGILLIFKKKIHPIILIVISAALGIVAGFAGELIK
jgi:chromate transporter